MSNEKDLTKDGKSKKTASAPALASSAKVTSGSPGFGKAVLTQNADGTWKAAVSCVNGDPRKSVTCSLPAGITYYGGGRIANPSDATLYLPDGANVDAEHIFPWVPNDPDPMRLGGGIIKGEVQEGAQRMNPKPRDPLQAPFILSEWVDGAAYKMTAYVPADLGVVFLAGDQAFAMGIVTVQDGVSVTTITAVAKKEGTCLDMPTA